MAKATLRNAVDSWTRQAKPKKNFGTRPRLILRNSAGNNQYGWLYFTRPWPPGVTIIKATLRLYNVEAWSGSSQLVVQRANKSWPANKVNWSNQPGVTGATAQVTKSNPAAGTLWEIDITAIIQAVANGAPWFGLRLITNRSAVSRVHSAQSSSGSRRPTLEVEWSEAPDEPENLKPGGNRAVPVSHPVLSFDFNDPAGDTNLDAIHVQFGSTQALLQAGTTTWDSGILNGVTEPELDLATTSYPGLANNTATWWRVRARDGAGLWSVWSTPVQFRRVDRGVLTITNPTPEEVARNYIHNPSSNNGAVAPWDVYSSVSTSHVALTSEVVDGRRAFRTEKLQQSNNLGMSTDTGMTNRPEGTKVTISAWGRNPVGSALTFFSFIARDAPNNDSSLLTGNVLDGAINHAYPADGVWRRYHVTFIVPAGRTFTRVYVAAPNAAIEAGQYHHMRDVMVRDGDLADFFDGDTEDQGEFTYGWSGTPHASPSVKSGNFFWEGTPPIEWTLTGVTQKSYQVILQNAVTPDLWYWNSGKITSTDDGISVPVGAVQDIDAEFRIAVRVWDTVDREAIPGHPVYYEEWRNVSFNYDPAVAPVTNLNMSSNSMLPVAHLTWERATEPDEWQIQQSLDGGVTWRYVAEIDGGDASTGGTTYEYDDIAAPSYRPVHWRVLAVAGRQSANNPTVSGEIRRIAPWIMRPDKSDAIFILNPQRSRFNNDVQEIHQTMLGPPVLITQRLGGKAGSISGRLAGDVVEGLSSEVLYARFRRLRRDSGMPLRLWIANEALKVVAFNFEDDVITDASGITYSVSFDWAEIP